MSGHASGKTLVTARLREGQGARGRGSRLAAVLGLVLLGGCDGPGPATYTASGTVTLDGNAIPTGTILFYPADKSHDASSAPIRAGAFSVSITAGTKHVQITAHREVPGKKDALGMALIEQYIPERYNAKTALTVEVTPENTRFEFPLQSALGKGKGKSPP